MKLEVLENVFPDGKDPDGKELEYRLARDFDFPPGKVGSTPIGDWSFSGWYSIALSRLFGLVLSCLLYTSPSPRD